MATPPVTPNTPDPNVTNANTPTPNAQGTSNPPAALPANGNMDPNAGANITPQSDPAANAPSTGQMVSNSPSTAQPQPSSSTAPNTPQSSGSSGNPPARSLNSPYANTVTPKAAMSPTQPLPTNPSVIHGSVVNAIATALTGGPRFKESIDPNTGTISRTQVPVSTAHLGMAIAMEFLGGMARGAGVPSGPGFAGRAAAAGFAGGQQDQQAAQQNDQAQGQQDFQNQLKAKAAQGAAFESNSRARLNTIQAEQGGIKILQAAANQNADLLAQQEDMNNILESHVSQDELTAGMQSGRYHAGQNLGIPDGWVMVGDKPEQTFSIIRDPSLKVPMSQQTWDMLSGTGDPQHAASVKLGPGGAQVTTAMASIANQKLQARSQMNHDISQFTSTLTGSKDPATAAMGKEAQDNVDKYLSDPQSASTGNYILNRLQRFRAYAKPGSDMYQTLQQMQQAVPDPANPGHKKPSPYAQTADQLAGMFGGGDVQKGWSMLKAADQEETPTEIKTIGQAENIINDPASSPKAVRVATATRAQMLQDKAAEKADGKGGAGKGGAVDGVPESTLVDQIARGQIAPTRWDYLLSKNPGLMAQVAAKDPNFDSSKASSYPQVYKDFTSGKTNQQLLSGGVALQHLAQLKQINDANPIDVHNPSSAPYKAYNNLLDTVAGELATFYGDPKTDTAIASKKSTLGGLLNRDAAIKEQASAMGAKMDELEQRWKNAAPSKYYEAPMPGLSDKAKAARAALDPNYTYTPSTQGSGSNSSLNPNPSTPQLHNGQHMVQVTIPAGASQVRDANKNVIGYMQNGQYTPIGGK